MGAPTPPDHTTTADDFGTEQVTDLLAILDPIYRVEGLNDDGDVDPDWNKIQHMADQMRAGTFAFDDSPLLIVRNPDGQKMVFDGNHRVLAAHLADIATFPVGYTSRPLG